MAPVSISRKALRSTVFNFYQIHKDKGKKYTIKHFEGQYDRKYLYQLLKAFDERGTDERKKGSGRKKKLSKTEVKKLVKDVNHKTGCSQRKLARKFKVSLSTINKYLKSEKVIYKKRKRAPKQSEDQKKRAKSRLSKLCRGVFKATGDAIIIMDDESYFTLDGAGMPGNSGYYTTDMNETPCDVKHRTESKFPEKVMIWNVISEKGCGQLYVSPKRQSMNKEHYIKNCLPRVEKFKKKYYNAREQKKVWFWPDLATCHYANDSLAAMTAIDLQYITKDINPPNCPQIRPIEHYWSILKQKVYENNWSAKKCDQLIRRIKSCEKN